ncbi:MAG: flagellar biosynthetic protein FliR [Acidobacteria bacterium]|nr:flagellar biosynthetic protein FliR [Acidobacteriota bacterium]
MENAIYNFIELFLEGLGIKQSPVVFLSLYGLIMARLVPAINYTPFLGGAAISAPVKIALAFTLTFLIYPAMASSIPAETIPTSVIPFIFLAIKEGLIGFTLGYITSLVFYGIQSAGQMVDNARGATIAQLQNLQLSTQTSLLGNMKLQVAIVLFFTLDGHLLYLKALFYSFERLPVNAFPKIAQGLLIGGELSPIITDIIRMSADVLLVSMQLAAPVLVCLFLTDVVFGIFNRVAPQMNVFFLSLPVKMLIGIGMLFLVWTAIIAQMEERFVAYLKVLYTIIAKATFGN